MHHLRWIVTLNQIFDKIHIDMVLLCDESYYIISYTSLANFLSQIKFQVKFTIIHTYMVSYDIGKILSTNISYKFHTDFTHQFSLMPVMMWI